MDYYDSLFQGRIKDHVKLKIANLSKTENSELEIYIHSCQQQKDGVDCGMFPVVNAYYILSGNDASSIRIYEHKMRADFRLSCLEQGRFQPVLTLFSHLKVLLVLKYFADVECRGLGSTLKIQL